MVSATNLYDGDVAICRGVLVDTVSRSWRASASATLHGRNFFFSWYSNLRHSAQWRQFYVWQEPSHMWRPSSLHRGGKIGYINLFWLSNLSTEFPKMSVKRRTWAVIAGDDSEVSDTQLRSLRAPPPPPPMWMISVATQVSEWSSSVRMPSMDDYSVRRSNSVRTKGDAIRREWKYN